MRREYEWEVLELVAEIHGVDPYFLGAIRLVENGGPGREMGVLTVDAPTFEDQARVAAKTVRNRLVEFAGNPLEMRTVLGPPAYRRLVYSEPWIMRFARQWAPMGVPNDPMNLNAHWMSNCLRIYADIVQRGVWP